MRGREREKENGRKIERAKVGKRTEGRREEGRKRTKGGREILGIRVGEEGTPAALTHMPPISQTFSTREPGEYLHLTASSGARAKDKGGFRALPQTSESELGQQESPERPNIRF